MDDRSKLTLLRGIQSGAFNDRQKLDALRAIKSNADDAQVGDLIGSLAFTTLNTNKSLKELVDDRRGIDREKFDYDTGADGRLRSLMSFGETDADRESILKSLVGEEGYVKDSAGRLALTEAGQKARGMEPIGKNLVIEDEGFSMRDFSDLAGVLPETVGSIAGAVAGGGLTFGLGSVAGAGLGAAAGQAIEEAVETLLGVQTQSFKDVVKDVAIEGAIGAGGELIGAGVVAAGKGLMGGAGALGRRAMRGPVDEIAEQTLTRAESLTERGFVPSIEAIGGPRPLALAQKFAENASRNLSRMENNLSIALKEKDDFLKGISGDVEGELRDDIMFAAPSKFSQLVKKEQAAKDAYLKAIDDSINILRQANDGGFEVNKDILTKVTQSFAKFNQDAADNFGLVDDILGEIQIPSNINGNTVLKEAGKAKIFNTKGLQNTLKNYLEDAGNIELLDPAVAVAYRTVNSYNNGMASFRNLARLRKEVNDNLFFNPGLSTEGGKQLSTLRGILDNMLDSDDILNNLRANILPNERSVLANAAKQRNFAISQYKEGIKRFEELSQLGIIRSINELKGESPRVVADKFFSRVVKPDEPQRLQAVLGAVDDPEILRDNLARSFLDDALNRAGRDLADPDSFDGVKFYNAVKGLKDTGKVLFGDDWGKVQSLARAIRQSKTKGVDAQTISRVAAESEGAGIAKTLQNIADAQISLKEATDAAFMKKLSEGNISLEDAVAQLSSPTRTDSEVMRIMRFFDDQPEIKEKIKQLYLTDILKSVDKDVFASQKNANALKETLESYKPNVLKRVLGKEQAEALSSFAEDLSMLGDVGKEGSIAAASIWARMFQHPINALTSIGKFRFMANMFNNPEMVKKYIRMRKATAGNPEARADAMLSMMNDQAVEAGMDVQRAQAIASKIGAGVGGVTRTIRQTAPRAAGVGSFDPQLQTRTSVPNVQAPLIDFTEIPERAPAPTVRAPLSPIEQIQRNAAIKIQQQSLRERARENPAVATTLLGGLGSAGLL
jgi:hypothetical protein